MSKFKGVVTVSIVGKPNAGKSTLLNALIGQKVSIVSPKKQTTRENILGILNQPDHQIVFVDTPGIHKTTDDLGKSMMKSVRSAMEDVDVVLYLVDATKPFDSQEFENIVAKSQNLRMMVLVTKIDLAGFEKTYPLLDKFSKVKSLVGVLPISSKQSKNLDVLLTELTKFLVHVSEDELYFDREAITDKSVRFLAQEMIREKALYLLDQEVPHGIFVEITKFEEGQKLTVIDADIICKKHSHKAIIIGKQGAKLKQIATLARKDIEQMLGTKVLLTLFVKSRKK